MMIIIVIIIIIIIDKMTSVSPDVCCDRRVSRTLLLRCLKRWRSRGDQLPNLGLRAEWAASQWGLAVVSTCFACANMSLVRALGYAWSQCVSGYQMSASQKQSIKTQKPMRTNPYMGGHYICRYIYIYIYLLYIIIIVYTVTLCGYNS